MLGRFNGESCLRLARALAVVIDGEWAEGARYLIMALERSSEGLRRRRRGLGGRGGEPVPRLWASRPQAAATHHVCMDMGNSGRRVAGMADGANVKQAVPFFRVEDMERSVRWYVEGLGAVITRRWEPDGKLRRCWLQIGGAALMLQEYLKEGQAGTHPNGQLGLGVSVCFMCDDAIAI
jgi:hypothetical protein